MIQRATMAKATELTTKLFEAFGGREGDIYFGITGGLVYKGDGRKDIDLVIYRNRQSIGHFETEDYLDIFRSLDMQLIKSWGFVTKFRWEGIDIDILNPETAYADTLTY